MTTRSAQPRDDDRVLLGGAAIDRLTEAEVVAHVADSWSRGLGGLIVTPNVDILRLAKKDSECAQILSAADLVVADGAPLVWAARLAGTSLPERVTGSGLVESLSASAARAGRSVYVLGGGAGDVALRAARCLQARHVGLEIAGSSAPPFGFDQDPVQRQKVIADVSKAKPDMVFVGMGFPRQEKLAIDLLDELPQAWFLGCGAGIPMAAGDLRRPPRLVQLVGLEWLARLAQEPRRLARRYLVQGMPAAITLLGAALRQRMDGLRGLRG